MLYYLFNELMGIISIVISKYISTILFIYIYIYIKFSFIILKLINKILYFKKTFVEIIFLEFF